MAFLRDHRLLVAFTGAYLAGAALYFLRDLNIEFVIYVGVILLAFLVIAGTHSITRLPAYILWLVAIWGLMHIFGGAVPTHDGVLFAYRIYPFLDHGGDFYILKYDQVVHAYLYGVVALAFLHMLRTTLHAGSSWLVWLLALLAAMGVGALNEIMEFLISLNMQNGVGGYENTLLDLIFNFLGALIALSVLRVRGQR
jgi:putative membrane protein